MNTNFINKCKLFSTEIKEITGSFFSDVLNYDQLKNIDVMYKYTLRLKRHSIENGFNDSYFNFTAKDCKINELVSYNIRPSNKLTNDQILKLIIATTCFYSTIEQIMKVLLINKNYQHGNR